MSLYNEFKFYMKRQARLIERAKFIHTNLDHDWIKVYATESLISDTWQLWNTVCKNLLVKSCQGCMGRSGYHYPARNVSDNSFERIAYEIKQYGRKYTPKPGNTLLSFWEYPTWGDGSKILHAINGLQSANTQNLITAFGLPLFGHKHIQTLRNYLFHKDQKALNAVIALTCFSGKLTPAHPSYFVWEYSSINNTFYYFEWINDMKHIIYR